jgi:hypothetical protein
MKTLFKISKPNLALADSFVTDDDQVVVQGVYSDDDEMEYRETDPFMNRDEREEDLLNNQLNPQIGDMCLRYYYKTAKSASIIA